MVATDAGTAALLEVASAVAAALQPATQSSRSSDTWSLLLSFISYGHLERHTSRPFTIAWAGLTEGVVWLDTRSLGV